MALTHALMALTHELGRSWGHGGTKSPLGMMASAALFPLASGHSVLGVPAIMPVAEVLAAALFPVTLGHSVLGVPCSLLLFFLLLVARPFVGCCCTLDSCDQAS